ncbi:multidrug transporter [Vibrio vulnificus]
MDKFFKVSAITAAMVGAIAAAPVSAADQVGPQYAGEVSEFFAESTISGNLNFFMRARDRGNFANGSDTEKTTNLDHGSIFANLGFNSGYVGGVVGFDAVIYSTFDMWQNGGADHEMNFWNVNNPYDKTANTGCAGTWDADCNDNGVSFATAAAKFKFGESFTAKLGYFQPSVPSSLGVNWSFAPGSYRGGEIGGSFGKVAVGLVVADEYKAPWFKETYEFRTTKNKDAGTLYSLGARVALDNGLSLDFGYGALTDGDRKNAHFKLKGTTEGGLYWSPQLYVVEDDEQYDSTAFQLAFLSSFSSGQYSYRAEATFTSAEAKNADESGNMAYRLTSQYGGSNGAYDIWWNNRSDFNHDGEFAGFLSVSRDFSDIGGKGFSAGISGAFGFGAEAKGYDDLKEYAYSLFANYAIQAGALKDANVSFYYTQYFNDTDAPNWTGYTNLFQDETDFKLMLTIPFNVK